MKKFNTLSPFVPGTWLRIARSSTLIIKFGWKKYLSFAEKSEKVFLRSVGAHVLDIKVGGCPLTGLETLFN